ncbi:MAG: hypothetical protein HWE34_04435 [Methylocystaceae bacterium]|nr:hypothetical protein [Methylocystaceae bacterium]
MLDVVLIEGIKIGQKSYTTVFLNKLTAGEAMDAADAAESIKMADDGKGGVTPIFQTSPARADAERIRRMIKKLETIEGDTLEGPVQLKDLRSMDEFDYRKLTSKVDEMEQLLLKRETDNQGRSESAEAEDGSGASEA